MGDGSSRARRTTFGVKTWWRELESTCRARSNRSQLNMGNIRNLYVTLLVLVVCVFCYGQETHQKFKVKLAALTATKEPIQATEEPRSGLRYHHNPRTCGEADLCCNGQNNTCFVFGRRLDGNNNESRCYCDSNCLVMADCCVDYHEHCKGMWKLYLSIVFFSLPFFVSANRVPRHIIPRIIQQCMNSTHASSIQHMRQHE